MESDVFKVALVTGQTLSVSLEHPSASGDLDLLLYAGDGSLLEGSETPVDVESIEFMAPMAGSYFVWVQGSTPQTENTY
jgi:hypothetical protein